MHIHTSELLTTKWQSDCVTVNLGVKWQRDYDNPFCFLLWFRNLSNWFQNLPFVLLFRRFLNSIHILSEMVRNLWSFLNRLSFYLILLNFFERIKERHSTKQKKTMSRTRCKNPLFYAPNARLEKERKKERMRDRWNWNGIRDSEKEKERKRDGWKLIYDSRSGFFLRRSRHRDRSPVDWWMITQSSRSTRQRQSPPPPHGYRTDGSVVWLAVIKCGMKNSARPWLPLFTQDWGLDSLTWSNVREEGPNT